MQQDVINRTYKIGCEDIEMTDKETQLKKLYEDAAYLHLFHSGYKVRRDIGRIHWNDEDL